MFKLLKDLTRPPEPLTPSPQPSAPNSPAPVPYVARERARSISTVGSPAPNSPAVGTGVPPFARAESGEPPALAEPVAPVEVEVKETNPDALRVVELLSALRDITTAASAENDNYAAGHMMQYIETFAQLLSVHGHFLSRRGFRRHKGFDTLVAAMARGLCWREQPPNAVDEEWQVFEVQRAEGLRLAFEVLAWATADRPGLTHFEKQGGYMGLLPILRLVSPRSPPPAMADNGDVFITSPDPTSPESPATKLPPASPEPFGPILGLLLAHLLTNNYSLLAMFSDSAASSSTSDAVTLEDKLGSDICLRPTSNLRLFWTYLWGLDDTPGVLSHLKRQETIDLVSSGRFEGINNPMGRRAELVNLAFRVLNTAIHSSTPNLFLVHNQLPELIDFLLTRSYGPEAPRKFEVTFPSRDEWYLSEDQVTSKPVEWKPPSPSLRRVYLSMLRRMLEAGVTQEQSWRLFELVRSAPKVTSSRTNGSSAVSPVPDSGNDTPRAGSPSGQDENGSKPFRGRAPLKLVVPTPPIPAELETLRPEVLDLIQHAMKTRWPDVFVFRGGRGNAAGGIQLNDLGRPWMQASKGFTFSCWLYITKLNEAITVVHMSQKDSNRPLFRVRILENSQIGLYSSVHKPTSGVSGEAPTEDDSFTNEIVCSAPDALVPHHQWVHFTVGCRRGRSTSHAEARIYIDGRRVGAVRIMYPVPMPPSVSVSGSGKVSPTEGIRTSVGCEYVREDKPVGEDPANALGRAEDNEWMLGRTLLLEETVSEDLVLLMHHLGPRYSGNMQEPLGKFLTYEGATSINVYLSSVAQNAAEKTATLLPNNSSMVRAIRTGPAIQEDNVVISLSPKDVLPPTDRRCSSDSVMNSAIPHITRTRAFRHGTAAMTGGVYGHASPSLDEAVSAVGGGVIVLKLIDMAKNSTELAATLNILRDMIRDSWSASEEMERIHGFDLLAAILRPKMIQMIDIDCVKIILSILGISADKASAATVVNSAAYRSIGLEFELWALAPLGVVSLYFQHFDWLLTTSKHKRFNLLRTFQKSNVVRRLLYTIRSGLFEPTVVPLAVDALRLILVSRWSSEDGIKPIFSYLVSALCQSPSSGVFNPAPDQPPSPPQLPAAQVFAMVAEVLHNQPRLIKLNKSLSLHRLLVIFLSSNPMPHVALPSLDILEHCLTTPGLEWFQRSFESEGGFALLARTLAPIWTEKIQKTVFRIILGPTGVSTALLQCPPGMVSITTALDQLLQAAGEDESINRPSHGRTRSGTVTSLRSMAVTPLDAADPDTEDDDRLEALLVELTRVYRASSPFRRGLTVRRIETMMPNLADFAAVSAASLRQDAVRSTRMAALGWINALIDLSKAPAGMINQLKLIAEQLTSSAPSPRMPSSPSLARSPMSPPTRPATSYFGSSIGNRFGTSPSTSFTPSSPRRRPSTDSTMSLYRTRSGLEKRTPLKRVLTGESILAEEKDKNSAWKMIILQTDTQRHATMTLDRKDHWNRLSQAEWPKQVAALRAEYGVWAEEGEPVTWRIDGSEGPLRMRNRLERINAVPEQGMAKTRQKLRDAIPSADELSSAASRVNSAPWEDPFALALGDAAPIAEEAHPPQEGNSQVSKTSVPAQDAQEGIDNDSYVDVEDDKSDKMRRIAKTLEAGDVVEEAHNIVRIVGVDACPGLLIFGKRNLYLIDGLVQTPEGQIIEASQAPQDVLSIPSGTLVELETADQLSYRWLYNEIVESNKRAFLFRDVALELYFSDKRNFLIVFKDKKQRQAIVQKLSAKIDHRDAISRSVIGNFVLDTVAKAIDKSESQLESMTRRWQNREISNFAYLQLLNQHANRTPNDVTQYPVFPWVLSDYTSQTLDLSNPASFRDLSLPMGALTPARREAAAERYSATEGVGEKPFHYGTHYTSSMIVCGFMIRLSPFTEIFLALQGGNFDLADRLFSSIPRAWDSASNDNRGDVRELIPEFYYSPAFLVNVNHHDFGRKQVSGDTVDSVVLPPWALDDPLLFTHLHRDALESDYVSRHLPQWIDLTFGSKQRDPASFNCFHPLSYRGAVDLEQMEDDNEKAASTAIIHNFGQTPLQIFKAPHPHRYMSGRTTLPVGVRFGAAEHWQLLLRSILPITETTTPIDDIVPSTIPEAKPGTQQRYRLIVPGHPQLSVQFGFADQSLRVYHQDSTPRMICIVEGIAATHAVFAAPTLVITVSPLGVLTAWRLTIKGLGYKRGEATLQREATLRGHHRPVTCLAVSTAWSLLVSGSEDGVALVWDMNRLRYIRALQTPGGKPIKMAAINEADGHIALATARSLYLFTLNGHPIASTSLGGFSLPTFSFGDSATSSTDHLEFTGSITFLRREFLKWGNLFVVGVGSELAVYRCLPGVRRFEDQAVLPWKIVEQGRLYRSGDVPSSEVAVAKFIGETLYAAFKPKDGGTKHALYQWSLPEGNARHVPESIAQCMADGCPRQFGLLEPRRHCGGCGGVFCGSHCVHVESFNMRYCETCRVRLSEATSLGVLPASRRGSVLTPAPGGGTPGSRRGSVLLHPTDARRVSGGSSGARSTSQPPSRMRTSVVAPPNGPESTTVKAIVSPRISFPTTESPIVETSGNTTPVTEDGKGKGTELSPTPTDGEE